MSTSRTPDLEVLIEHKVPKKNGQRYFFKSDRGLLVRVKYTGKIYSTKSMLSRGFSPGNTVRISNLIIPPKIKSVLLRRKILIPR